MNAQGYYAELNGEDEKPAPQHIPLLGRYMPEGSTVLTRADLPAVVYTFAAGDGKPAAIAYYGKKTKADWHYRFLNEAQRDYKINEFFENVMRVENFKIERAVAKKSFKHGYKIGDILYSSWGYDQTNIEFFQVTATTEKTVTFQEIMQHSKAEGFMSEEVTPCPGVFLEKSEPITRTVKAGYRDDKGSVSFATHKGGFQRYLWEYDGKPKHATSYA